MVLIVKMLPSILVILSFFAVICSANVASIETRADGNVKEWWQHSTVYQIYPRSFKDSNGDGIGDIVGITSKLDHLADIGVNAIWMSPMFQSPLKDFGYDISNFYEIHDEYGTMQDFEDFMKKANELNIGVLLDFVPNHSSDQCDWFVRSIERDGDFTDYYTWHDGGIDANGIRTRPNNWVSVFGGPAWTWNERRQQWYLHQFMPEQPDLNYRNPLLVTEMKKVLTFWLSKGIAGFRVDAINHMFEHIDMQDEPRSFYTDDAGNYEYLAHIYTKDQPETFEMIYDWRNLLNEYSIENNVPAKILMTEAYASIEDTMRYYVSANGTLGSHMPFNFQLIYIEGEVTAQHIKGNIDYWLNYMPEGLTPSWVTGSHDHSRVATRVGPRSVALMNTVNLMLPGTSITYYGEEIGMTDNLAFQISDSRDPNRTPMQWDSTVSAGFSTSTNTWLPVTANYQSINVAAAKAASTSHYHHFKELTALRKERAIIMGDLHSKSLNRDVFAFIREYPGEPIYVVIVNLANRKHNIDLSLSFFNLPENLVLVSASPESSRISRGVTSKTTEITLDEYEALVFCADSAAGILVVSTVALFAVILNLFL